MGSDLDKLAPVHGMLIKGKRQPSKYTLPFAPWPRTATLVSAEERIEFLRGDRSFVGGEALHKTKFIISLITYFFLFFLT